MEGIKKKLTALRAEVDGATAREVQAREELARVREEAECVREFCFEALQCGGVKYSPVTVIVRADHYCCIYMCGICFQFQEEKADVHRKLLILQDDLEKSEARAEALHKEVQEKASTLDETERLAIQSDVIITSFPW